MLSIGKALIIAGKSECRSGESGETGASAKNRRIRGTIESGGNGDSDGHSEKSSGGKTAGPFAATTASAGQPKRKEVNSECSQNN
jgi:hypothetical protein